MRLTWKESLRELPYWTALAPALLAEVEDNAEPPSPFRLVARSFSTHAAVVLLEDQQHSAWVRVSFWNDTDGWAAIGQRITTIPPGDFFAQPGSEVAWIHARGTVERDGQPSVVVSDLVVLHRPEVTALILNGTRHTCGQHNLTLLVSESKNIDRLQAVVAGGLVPIWHPQLG